jgi:hypothetical protein
MMFKNLSRKPTLKPKDQNAPQGVEIEMYWEKRGALGSEVKYFGTKF